MGMLLSLVSATHLTLVLFAAAAPCVTLWLEWQATRRGDLLADRLGKSLAQWAIAALLLGTALGGVAMLLVWWRGQTPYFEGFLVIPTRRIWFSVAELLVYLAGMAAYVRWWRTMPRWLHRFLAIFSATNLLYHFPPLFSAIAVASTRPQLWGRALEYRETLSLFGDPETLARTLHVELAAFVIAGVALLWKAQRTLTDGDATAANEARLAAATENATSQPTQPNVSPDNPPPIPSAAIWARRGGRMALIFTILQAPAGLLLLFSLPQESRDGLLMGDAWATLWFTAGIAALMVLLHSLAATSLGDTTRAAARNSALWLALLMFFMVAMRHRNRDEIYRSIKTPQLSTFESEAWHLQW